MSMFAKVRRLFHRDHLSISEIQRRTSLSRNTIKAWLKETVPDNYKYPKRPKVTSKLTPYIPGLLLVLAPTIRIKHSRIRIRPLRRFIFVWRQNGSCLASYADPCQSSKFVPPVATLLSVNDAVGTSAVSCRGL
jgi:hypothetical protein